MQSSGATKEISLSMVHLKPSEVCSILILDVTGATNFAAILRFIEVRTAEGTKRFKCVFRKRFIAEGRAPLRHRGPIGPKMSGVGTNRRYLPRPWVGLPCSEHHSHSNRQRMDQANDRH